MTYEEFHRQLGAAGLTLQEFAGLVRMNRRSISNYASTGRVPSHLAVIATLIAELAALGADFRSALAKVEISNKKPRGAGTQGRFGGDKQKRFDSLLSARK